jgi:hypothetical protein
VDTHERVRLFGGIAALHGVLDAGPELFPDPVTSNQHFDATQAEITLVPLAFGITPLQRPHRVQVEVRYEPTLRDDNFCLPAGLVWHGAHYTGGFLRLSAGSDRYAADVPVLLTFHVFGAIFLVGGVTTHLLWRSMAGRATDDGQRALYQLAWRIQVAMVYVGSALLLITGILLWIGRFKFFTGWLLLGVLLFVAAMGLDGALISRTIRPRRRASSGEAGAIAAAAHAESSATLAAAAMTVQVVAWFLLVVVVFLMVAKPF